MTAPIHDVTISCERGKYMVHDGHRARCSCGWWSDGYAQLGDTQRAVDVHLRRARRADRARRRACSERCAERGCAENTKPRSTTFRAVSGAWPVFTYASALVAEDVVTTTSKCDDIIDIRDGQPMAAFRAARPQKAQKEN